MFTCGARGVNESLCAAAVVCEEDEKALSITSAATSNHHFDVIPSRGCVAVMFVITIGSSPANFEWDCMHLCPPIDSHEMKKSVPLSCM